MKITAHDVAQLAKLNAAVQRWNAESDSAPIDVQITGPWLGWHIELVSIGTEVCLAHATADTLGDAIAAALTAWKESGDE